MQALDPLDARLVRALQHNARLSMTELGQRVGLSTSACSRRIARLEATGVLVEYRATVAPAVLNAGTEVRVQVTLDSQTESTLQTFESAIRRVPEVLSCELMAGGVDYAVKVAVADLAAYEQLHRRVLSALPGVARIESSFVLRNIVSRSQPSL
ncbi:MAG: Lrp/AsnC family transcriptional regulator [Pseudomonadota bacterium]